MRAPIFKGRDSLVLLLDDESWAFWVSLGLGFRRLFFALRLGIRENTIFGFILDHVFDNRFGDKRRAAGKPVNQRRVANDIDQPGNAFACLKQF